MQGIYPHLRTWSVWNRAEDPAAFRITPRDVRILAAVFRHRFLQPAHIHALMPDGSPANLNRRLKLLYDHGFLERPKAQRPTKILTEEIVYALANKGARMLEELDPTLNIGRLDWNDRPGKPLGWPYMDHQLHVATFFVALERACQARGILLEWPGHYERNKYRIPIPGTDKRFDPDAYFRLVRQDGRVAHHFVELMRSRKTIAVMRDKLENYFRWWRDGDGRSFKHFRVLTVTPDRSLLESLRRAAAPIGRGEKFGVPIADMPTWKGLMFTSLEAFSLSEPERVLEPIFRYADEDTPLALV